ncbi:MAG: ABC transporter permease [Desulfatitalea sp.]
MTKWLATVIKEWRLLARDWVGLLQLFVMPAILVVVITLVQDSILRQTSALRITGVLVNKDQGEAARMLAGALNASDVLKLVESSEGRPVSENLARQWVNEGRAQFYALIPAGFTQAMETAIQNRMDLLMAGADKASPAAANLPEIAIYFDPTLSKIYRAMVTGDLERATALLQRSLTMRTLRQVLAQAVRQRLAQKLGPVALQIKEDIIPPLDGDWLNEPLIQVAARSIGPDRFTRLPTAAQQNVPAWALFGMFFIVVPLSGAMITERREGVWARLKTMPVSMTLLILGKLTAYVGVCLVQFFCIAMIGRWLLPMLGTDAFIVDGRLGAIIVVALISALAAAGYGILLGTLSRTNQQAGIVGPLSVVIAAALGGIMVPVFAMPPMMQTISLVSPLAWAHEAFMILLVRGGSLSDTLSRLALLSLFFLVTFLLALYSLRRKR